MNGARTTFMRRGYLLTALAAAVLLAASPGTASAQSIGFVGSSGMVSETATLEPGAFEGPLKITIRASGLPAGAQRTASLGTLTLNAAGDLRVVVQSMNAQGGMASSAAADIDGAATSPEAITAVTAASFANGDEVHLLVVQQDGTDNGDQDDNWLDEKIRLNLTAGPGVSVPQAVYTVTVDDQDVAPVARFTAPSFTLTEGSERAVSLDIQAGVQGGTIPGAAVAAGETGTVTVRVGNHQMVTVGASATSCTTVPAASRKAVHIALADTWVVPDSNAFGRTARISTNSTGGTIADLAAAAAAGMTISACNVSGFRDQSATLTILPTSLVEQTPARGNITIGSPLTVTVDSNEAAPTLSFSPTDVTIDEGGSTSTRLISDGTNATEVGMVKLMVEGDAMVDLYHEDTLLEEMNGYVTVDMGMSNSARLTAMSTSDPDLMDGDMAYKAWKLTDGSSDAMVGDDSWFRVDVRGSTAVPALPLVGQLLLALFLMAGGSRLYRRRQG